MNTRTLPLPLYHHFTFSSVLKLYGFLPNTVRKGLKVSQVRKHETVVSETRVVLVIISPGPALTLGPVLDISKIIITVIYKFINHDYPAENLTLSIVRDRSEVIQQCGVIPGLVNLENNEISSVDLMMQQLRPCNRRICQSSSLPSPGRRTRRLK